MRIKRVQGDLMYGVRVKNTIKWYDNFYAAYYMNSLWNDRN